MGIITKLLQPLVNNFRYKEKVEELRTRRIKLDNRITRLQCATFNGEDEWMLKIVRKNPSCAMKIIQECDKNEHIY